MTMLQMQIKRERQLERDYPDAGVAVCLTCYRRFADVHPSARCPFEAWHDDPPSRIRRRQLSRIREGLA